MPDIDRDRPQSPNCHPTAIAPIGVRKEPLDYTQRQPVLGNGERVVVAALVSPKWEITDELFVRCWETIRASGGECVGILIQRRGVSRSKRPGGVVHSRQALPMSPAYYLGREKVYELAETVEESKATLCILLNQLSESQRKRIKSRIGCRVFLYPFDQG
ncbi:MAG: hypothetical protein ACFB9N_14175 [Geitlerinemataceae cyanobacterium]